MNPTRRDTPFREAMRSLLVFDGAMGSLLYERGDLRHPELRAAQRHPARGRRQDPRGLRRRRRAGHRDQYLWRQQLLSGPPRPGRPGARVQRRRRPAGAQGRRRGRLGGGLDRPDRPGPRGGEPGRARPGRGHLRRAGRRARGGRRRPVRARDLPAPRGDPDRHRRGPPGRARAADHRVDGLQPQRDGGRRLDAGAGRHHPARLGRRRHRRQLRRRPAAGAGHRRAHARWPACRSACSPTPACPGPSTVASSTWPRRSTSTCSRAAPSSSGPR